MVPSSTFSSDGDISRRSLTRSEIHSTTARAWCSRLPSTSAKDRAQFIAMDSSEGSCPRSKQVVDTGLLIAVLAGKAPRPHHQSSASSADELGAGERR